MPRIDQLPSGLGERWRLPAPPSPTLSELFAEHPRDGGWVGFLLAQLDTARPLLWVQDRMAILESGRVHPPGFSDRLESGRIHPPGLPSENLIHIETRDAKDALWAMEEGVRCSSLAAVIGEIWGDPKVLDFTATRRLAVTSERSGVPCWLVRLGGTANLSGARMRWRIASAPSLVNALDPKAPGQSAWDTELFRARGHRAGRWNLAYEGPPSKSYFDGTQAGAFHRVAGAGDPALGEDKRLSA